MTMTTTSKASAATAQAWSERNQQWLSRRLAFWRERLEHLAGAAEGTFPEAPPASDADEADLAVARVAALFGLSAFETELLVLAAGVEINVALRRTVARVQGVSNGRPVRLRFSTALALLPQAHWDALSPLAPLRRWQLVEFDAATGFTETEVRIDERILHYITGVAAFDEKLTGAARLEADADVADEERAQAHRIARTLDGVRGPLVMFAYAATDPSCQRSGRAVARETFGQLGLRTLAVDHAALSSDLRALADMARRLDRDAALAPAGIVISLDADAGRNANVVRLVSALRTPVITLGALEPLQLADLDDRPVLRFTIPSRVAIGHCDKPVAIRRALQQFRVDPALLDQALASIGGAVDGASTEQALWIALRELARGGMDGLAERIESRATLNDLVAPPGVLGQLREMVSQLRHRQTVYEEWGFGERNSRGLGIAALFAGETGTGKTLAAEAIANEAGLDLYRIDLASVVSKYIGETEKNLSRVFEAAEQSGAVLLFDEADALFGKRSEVKDSHDRYANIEVAYLLQRIEAYRGLAILATNLRSSLDRAFLRRIRFVVQFPFPDPAARAELWQRQFPPRAPLGDVDVPALARLQLSGGHIRSVALNAAFQAAAAGEPIGQAMIMAAARAEFAKLERPLSDAALSAPAGSRDRR